MEIISTIARRGTMHYFKPRGKIEINYKKVSIKGRKFTPTVKIGDMAVTFCKKKILNRL
jgi:hypothetical protein